MATKLSALDIARLAAAAGFTGDNLVIAVAVALAESGGDPAAVGDTTLRYPSYGLWQINGVHDADPAFVSRGWKAAQAAEDPALCAGMAYVVAGNGVNWQPWSTYKSGAYQEHMAAAHDAVASLSSAGAPSTGGGGSAAPNPSGAPGSSPATGTATGRASDTARLAFAVEVLQAIATNGGGGPQALAATVALKALREL